MVEKETKTIDVKDCKIGGTYTDDGKEAIETYWNSGWDLESITGYYEDHRGGGGYTITSIPRVKLHFVRDRSIPIIAKLAELEKEYEKNNPSYVPRDSGVAPVKPAEPIKPKFGVGWIILSFIVLALFLIGIIGKSIFFIIVGVIGLVILISRILNILRYKTIYKAYIENDKVYMEKYKVYMEKDTAYREKLSNYERNRTEILEKMKSLGSDNLRQSSLKKSLDTWKNRPSRESSVSTSF